MAASESSRTNQNAVLAIRAMLGSSVSDDTAAEVVEAVRPHLERPYQLALAQVTAERDNLKVELERITNAQA